MSSVAEHASLEALLRHPSLWRGRTPPHPQECPPGFPRWMPCCLAAAGRGRGWSEIITTGAGHGELALWTPMIRTLTRAAEARCCAFIAPPFELFAPAWRATGARLDRLLIARATEPLWALEQSLLSGVCALGFAWPQQASMTELRRLALAAERGAALCVLVRPLRAAVEPTAASLRLMVRRGASCLRLELTKARGVAPRSVELPLP